MAKATDGAQRSVAALTQQVRVEWTRAVWLLCGAAWLFGTLGGVVFERWRVSWVATPPPVATPSSPAESKKPMHETPRPPRHQPAPVGPVSEQPRGTVMEQHWNTDGTATGTAQTKPKA